MRKLCTMGERNFRALRTFCIDKLKTIQTGCWSSLTFVSAFGARTAILMRSFPVKRLMFFATIMGSFACWTLFISSIAAEITHGSPFQSQFLDSWFNFITCSFTWNRLKVKELIFSWKLISESFKGDIGVLFATFAITADKYINRSVKTKGIFIDGSVNLQQKNHKLPTVRAAQLLEWRYIVLC